MTESLNRTAKAISLLAIMAILVLSYSYNCTAIGRGLNDTAAFTIFFFFFSVQQVTDPVMIRVRDLGLVFLCDNFSTYSVKSNFTLSTL